MAIKKNNIRPDTFIDLLDQTCMFFYRQVRQNARRIAHLIVTVLPLMALLVGSCKTSQMPVAYGGSSDAEKFRMALFPSYTSIDGSNDRPASGYISLARDFIESAPEKIMLLKEREIGYLFGKPSLRRKDADAQVWQYKTSGCVIDFYFYGHNQLSYVDIRRKGEKAGTNPVAAQSTCLHEVAAATSSFGVGI